jgi:CRISPR/Cas system-associated endonuclease/helicase Cas3
MSDESVRAALRSDAPLVVIEAPAGCGKTHHGADYARTSLQRAAPADH